MKKYILVLIVLLAITQGGVIGYLVWSSSSEELVYIDSAKLLDEYKGMQEARQAFQRQSQSWQANIDTLVNEIEQQITDHEMNIPQMSTKRKNQSEEEIRKKQKELIQYQEAIQKKAAEADNKMTAQVLAEVNSFLQSYGDSRKYKMILAATNAGNIVHANEGLNITKEVIEELNRKYLAK
ncbi:MAG: OmpH family outer membrane protein [Reichenbachiella sp.]|uniref:OmpH family outer membrane protein n=1 Tax=Reichenbachiella sp. TaxID=2184521 RepID=UPI0032642D65